MDIKYYKIPIDGKLKHEQVFNGGSGSDTLNASSASVYGDGPFNEDAVCAPKNLYAKSKLKIFRLDSILKWFLYRKFFYWAF